MAASWQEFALNLFWDFCIMADDDDHTGSCWGPTPLHSLNLTLRTVHVTLERPRKQPGHLECSNPGHFEEQDMLQQYKWTA